MTAGKRVDTVTQALNKNWMTIGAGLLALYTGYLTGTTNAENRIENLEREVLRLEGEVESLEGEILRVLRGRHGFINEVTPMVNYLCQKTDGCPERFGVVRVPE